MVWIFWEEFFGRIFLGGFFWEEFLGRNFLGEIFWEKFFGRNFWERNSLFTLLRSAKLFEYGIWKEFMFLSRFWGNARKKDKKFRSLEVRGKLIALKNIWGTLVTQPMLQRRPNQTESVNQCSYIQILCRFQKK